MTPIPVALSRSRMGRLVAVAAVALLLAVLAIVVAPRTFAHGSSTASHRPKPTIVLVHGDWADASGWSGEIQELQRDGYRVVAIPNPLRALSGDAAYVRAYLDTVPGPIVLVGHSYGGAVITNAATGVRNVHALVYIDAFIPDQGQSTLELAGPDSALSADPTTIFDFVPATLPPTPTTDLYLKTSTFLKDFANGVPMREARILAATQRPATLAQAEPSGVPAWRTIPSWALIGTQDHIIPPAAEQAMAKHAAAHISNFNQGHLGLITDPRTVTRVIEHAARATD